MNFQELLSKMQELDQPIDQETTEGCGDPMPMPTMNPKPDEPPPSMSVNLNAQGMDNIEDLMKLIMKVNPEMNKPSIPPMGMEPPMASIAPSLPPLKMLPDMDSDNDDMPGGEKDKGDQPAGLGASLDRDGDGDHDMDDHDLEKKKEGFANGTDDDTEPEYKDVDYMVNKLSGGLGRKQAMYKHSYKQGDNPMAMEGNDLRAAIRAELLQRLAEAKGAK